MSNISRRQDVGLGKTAAGGSGGSFAAYERAAAAPPAAHLSAGEHEGPAAGAIAAAVSAQAALDAPSRAIAAAAAAQAALAPPSDQSAPVRSRIAPPDTAPPRIVSEYTHREWADTDIDYLPEETPRGQDVDEWDVYLSWRKREHQLGRGY